MKKYLIALIGLVSSLQLSAQIYEMDLVDGQTISTCSGTFYDSETIFFAPDYYYDVGENYTTTFCSSIPGNAIRIDFDFIQTVAGEDTLWVYDGPTATGTPLAVFSGAYGATSVVGFSGCLTFVFISTGGTVSIGWQGAISCFNYPPVVTQPACTNIGFESGNFSGWYGTYGYPDTTATPTSTPISTGSPGAPHPTYYADVYGATAAPHHTITTGAGTDPFGGFPVVAPNGGTNSMMLGDSFNWGYGGTSIEQEFNVTAGNAMMVYSYAVVIQDAAAGGTPHASEEQPFFKIEAFDCNGNSIPCGDYLVVGGPNIPGFTLAPGYTDVYFKPWTDVFLDLSPYVGSCVTVRFTQGDCSLGAHFSYVYLDALCGPLEITGNQWICPGETTTLTAPPGGASYLWSPGGQTTQTISVSPSQYTDYTCEITPVTGPQCTSTLPYWVDVHPPADITVNSETVCEGTPVTLTGVPNSVGGSYSWSSGGQTTVDVTYSPMVSGTDTVFFTDLNGCQDSAVATITVNPSPTPTITGTLAYCTGDSVQLSLTQAYPNVLWSTGETTPSIYATAADNDVIVGVTDAQGCVGSDTVTIIENTAAIYDLNLSICDGDSLLVHGNWESTAGIYTNTYILPSGCDSTLNITLSIDPLPIINAGPDESDCFGVPITLNATGAPTINWSDPLITNGIPFTPPVGTNVYIATGIDANNCSNTDTVEVIVAPLPTVDPITDDVICIGENTAAVTFTGSLPGTTYTWANSQPSIGLAGSGTGDIPSFVGLNPGASPIVATITVTPDNGVCTGAPETFTITVNPLPNIFAGNPVITCEGNTIVLTGTGGANYVWNNGVVDGVAFLPTSGWYTVTGTDANGCVNVDSVLVTVEPDPIPSFIVDVTPCAPYVATFTNTTSGSMSDCEWTISNGATLNGCGQVTYTFPNSGIFDVTLTTTSLNGCTGSATYTDIVTLDPNPNASFSPGLVTLSSLNTEVQFTNTSTNADSYVWDFGDNTPNSPVTNPLHQFPDEGDGTYIVTLWAYADNGCYDSIQSSVIVNEELIFYVPNTFTPDGDDYNEYFQAIFTSGYDPYDFHLMIFNRWGELIWESYDDSVGWDGTYAGNYDVQDGTYTWKIEFKRTANDERIMVVGHVNVLR